ncbi:MAG: serine--tRNA ligase [Ureaplasma sp.]|nr:serine--tRNA ligase [Ureaplasma sp.]
MFSIELIRNNLDKTKAKLLDRNFDVNKIDNAYELDKKNCQILANLESLLSQKNKLSKEIGILLSQNKKNEADELQNQVRKLNLDIKELEIQKNNISQELTSILEIIPNLCDDSVVIGKDENENVPQKYFKEPTKFDFNPLSHWELAEKLKLVDFDRATKISGSRFITYTNDGARLYRALVQFTLDNNVENGFVEILPPVILNSSSLYATGQLPKFKEDAYFLNVDEDFCLSPTAEVQLVNLHRNEILNNLPIRYTANTPCFRSEAGSAGRDVKGVLRLHQFYKSELVVICDPDESWNEHEKITRTAERILEKLELPYRRLLLCTGDTGFASAKTFDLEVWLPSYNSYKEISSCSNCLDFQARRAKIRMKKDGKNILVHTLNGSSLAIDRLWAAIVENYQQKDGTIFIPSALRPYFMNKDKIG